jgi:hypothetical protein
VKRAMLPIVVTVLALSPPAAAKEGVDAMMSPELGALVPGKIQTLVVRLRRIRDTRSGVRETPVRGVRPVLELVEAKTQRRRTAAGTTTGRDGRSWLRLAVPAGGDWRPTLRYGRVSFKYEPTVFGPVEASSAPRDRAPTKRRESGFAWAPAGAGLAGAFALLSVAWARRRIRRSA